jgi:outer membrane protein OmpU
MKKVLLTTTAVVFTAGFASAGDMSMSGAIKLTYGAFGTGTDKAGADAWTSEADLDIAASSASGAISVSGTLEIDEATETAAGPVTISMGAFSMTYDANDIGALAIAPANGDGEDDNYGDYSVSYSAGSLSATYVGDHESDDSSTSVSFTSGALTLGVVALDEQNGAGGTTGIEKTTVSATYVTGPYTISLSGDDQASQDWDASVAMASGDTTVTVAADETEMMSVGIAYAAGDVTVSARQEFNNPNTADDETEFGVTYTSGAITFGAAYDSGQNAKYGDEAELVMNVTYVDGDVTVAGKANDQDEMEVSVSFAF